MIELKGSFGKRFVEISGGLGEIGGIEKAVGTIKEIDESHGTTSQIFNASRIAGKSHLLHSSKLALESLESGNSFADSPRIELTCWTAGLRQIKKALKRVGIKENSKEIVVVTIGEKESKVNESHQNILRELKIKEDEKILELDEKSLNDLTEGFSISPEQLKVSSPEEIVLEKIALLELEK